MLLQELIAKLLSNFYLKLKKLLFQNIYLYSFYNREIITFIKFKFNHKYSVKKESADNVRMATIIIDVDVNLVFSDYLQNIP